jgi:outer membrane protein OmpA-like peptidoglycan-associated protein
VAVLSVSAEAGAQVDAERFKPAVTPDGWVNAEGSGVRTPDDPWELGAFLNYAVNPLVVVDQNGDVQRKLVSGRLGVDLIASLTLADPFVIGIDLPLFLAQSGAGDPSFAGLGDLRVVPKIRLLDDRESVGLALALELRAPTHLGDYSGGARNVVAFPKIIFDHRFLNGFRIGANAGILVREGTRLGNVDAASEFAYAAALGYRFGGISGSTEIGVELDGGVGLAGADAAENPHELFAFLRHEPSEEWEIMAGPGFGIVPGYGVPLFRVFAGVRYRPTSHDADHDGIPDDEDKCANVAEDRDHFEDTDGCPEEGPDSDKDGIPDYEDECPDDKETINGINDGDGCPDSGDPRVVYEDGSFKILDTVQFEHGSANIKQESHSLLDQVALTMKANPQVEKIRVEGHTDDTGPHDVNVRLSKERANSVRRYLIDKGVNAKRLSAEGYGPDKPLVDAKTPEARAKNRRVEFVVE